MKLRLLDTGYVGNSNLANQTQLSDGERAGFDGSTMQYLELDIQNISYSYEVNINSKPVVNSLDNNRITPVSNTNPTLNVTMIINKELLTANHEYNNMQTFIDYFNTRGLKLLYPSNTTDNTKKTIVEALGEKNKGGVFSSGSPSAASGTVSATTPYLVGLVRNPNINDTENSNFYKVTFRFVVTG